MTTPVWSTACLDWADRIREGRSIIPPPIFPEQAKIALDVFKQLRIVDAPNSPTFGEACAQWVFDLVASIFGAYDPNSGRRLITEWFVLVAKKNSKALALDTPIPTPRGWTTMGELKVGEEVIGSSGLPTKITAVSPVYRKHDCYRLTFSNGESVVADAGHLWKTSSLADNLRRPELRVRTTEQIVSTLLRRDGARNHSMPMPKPLLGMGAVLPVSPYTLGAWLGDGHSAAARITVNKLDQDIIEHIRAEGWPVKVSEQDRGSVLCAVTTGSGSRAARAACLTTILRQTGVLNNKHIPAVYLRASYEQRLALLQGLMDTDGCASASGRDLTWGSISSTLADGFCELLATFGIKHSRVKRSMSVSGRPVPGVYHAVQFMAFKDEIPVFRTARKLGRMLSRGMTRNSARSRTVQIVSAERVPSVPVRCIQVDSPDHQFLFGKTMLPTHNSTIAAGVMMTAQILNWRQSAEFVILAPTIEVSNNAFAPARDMCSERADEELSALMHVQTHVKTITNRQTNATLKVVAADENTVGGKKSVGTLIDELHLMGKNPHAENMLREALGGLASRPEGFVIFTTTQSDEPPAGVFKQKLQYARDVRDGKIHDPQFVPIIFEHPDDMVAAKTHLLLENMWMANPNLGYSVDKAFLEREFRKAKEAGEKSFIGFMAKHANVEVGMNLRSDRWAGADHWESNGDAALTLDALIRRSEVITCGIDGGGLDDLLGLCFLGRETGTSKWLHWGKAWAHKIVLDRRKEIAPRLLDFSKAGELTIVENPGDDLIELSSLVKLVEDSGLLERVGVDTAGIGPVVDALRDEEIGPGLPMERIVGVSQGWKMVGAIKTSERMLAGKLMSHGASALMAWSVGNAKVTPSGNAVIITKQASGSAKIDPVLATFNAVTLMALNPKPMKKQYQMFVLGA